MVDVHEQIRTRLARTRQRYTGAREELVGRLLAHARPASIPELLTGDAGQSQSSLYRNLGVLEQAGVVRRIASVDDAARYELAEEFTEHHHHVVCSTCGRIDDVVLPARIEAALRDAADEASRAQGYDVDRHHLELVGTCGPCRT